MSRAKTAREVLLGVIALPLFLVIAPLAAAISIPYTRISRRRQNEREDKFREDMKAVNRTMEWPDFKSKLSHGKGTLIVERFSFKGPVRYWWIDEDVYEKCPFPLVDWLTLCRSEYDHVREWFGTQYLNDEGQALLVVGNGEQWRSITDGDPLLFRHDVRYVDVPHSRHRK